MAGLWERKFQTIEEDLVYYTILVSFNYLHFNEANDETSHLEAILCYNR